MGLKDRIKFNIKYNANEMKEDLKKKKPTNIKEKLKSGASKASGYAQKASTQAGHNLIGNVVPQYRTRPKKKKASGKTKVIHHYHHYGPPKKRRKKAKTFNNPYSFI